MRILLKLAIWVGAGWLVVMALTAWLESRRDTPHVSGDTSIYVPGSPSPGATPPGSRSLEPASRVSQHGN